MFGTVKVAGFLRKWGVKGEVVGVTGKHPSGNRGAEIEEWLDRHQQHVSSFAIIDDDSFDMGKMKEFLVLTDGETGMNEEHADQAIAMIRGKEQEQCPSSETSPLPQPTP